MERGNDSPNEGDSSPDTVVGRSSSEEDRKLRTDARTGSTSGEYVTGVGESSSSLDTLIGTAVGPRANFFPSSSANTVEDIGKKKGRFDALKSTFRKIGRTKSRSVDSEASLDVERDDEEGSKASTRKSSPSREDEDRVGSAGVRTGSSAGASESTGTGKKKKKRNSLVRKLSLKKFRLGSGEQQQHRHQLRRQETTRHTPEGGDSSRSRSQSSQESPGRTDGPSRIAARKGLPAVVTSTEEDRSQRRDRQPCQERDRGVEESSEKWRSTSDRRDVGKRVADTWGSDGEKGAGSQQSTSRRLREETRREHKRESEQRYDKPPSTVTVVQRRSPSVTIGTSFSQKQPERGTDESQDGDQEHKEREEPTPETRIHCSVSTLPYAISKWSDRSAETSQSLADSTKKPKLSVKSDSESAVSSPTRPPVELRRKLSLLEEKRAIFQRRRYETSQDSSDDASRDTVVAASVDSTRKDSGDPENVGTKKRARQISVRTFDTFSTFEGTFDEDTGVGYLAGIEEDYGGSYLADGGHGGDDDDGDDVVEDDDEDEDGDFPKDCGEKRRAMENVGDNPDKPRSVSQESASSQNNTPNTGVGEKREHLYKILVIGELGAGKTSIIKRYVHQFFSQHYRATIGVDFALKVLNWDPHTIIRLQLWDIAGQERFGNMTRVYYKEAVGAFIVFDVTRSATLEAVVKWKQDLDSKVQLPDGSPIPCVLLANKCDQQKEGLVNTPTKMDEYCKEKNFSGWFETSAKENVNIEEAARFLVNKILQNDQIMKGNGSQEQTDGERFALNQSPTGSKKSCSC